MNLGNFSRYIGELLRIPEFPDYPNAINGLQLENNGQVTKIGAAVDVHMPVVRKAVAQGCDLLLVHHGLFWGGLEPLTGVRYEKFRLCQEHNLAIYSAHLPLDGHSELGNAIQLARALNLSADWQPFYPFKGFPVGMRGEVDVSRDALVLATANALQGPVHLCPGGPQAVRHLGIVTGGAGSEVPAMKALGIDTFITGEGPHWSYTLAEELGVNVLYGGHYATETFGVRALAEHLAKKFRVPWQFIDHPTGL